jgi:hypothetical protein
MTTQMQGLPRITQAPSIRVARIMELLCVDATARASADVLAQRSVFL